MIVVTGPGRSGTSLVASIYRKMGLDPQGGWDPKSRGGLEAPEIVDMNIRLLRELGLEEPARRFGLLKHVVQAPRAVRRAGRRALPTAVRKPLRSLIKEPPGRSSRRLPLIDWDRFDEAVARNRSALVALADHHPVAKDPRFCWTLGAWAAAGASIDHVLVCVRSMDAMLDSRVGMEWLAPRSRAGARNFFAYGLGLCVATIHDQRLTSAIVRFPDFLQNPDGLLSAMGLPEPTDRDRFLQAFRSLVREDLVGDQR
jgi:hypothetical protein